MKKRVVVGGVVVIAAAAFIIMGLFGSSGGETTFPVNIAEVTAREMVTDVQVTGNVRLNEPVRIYASNNGKLGSVLVKEGDYVKKGDVLFTYDEDNTDTVINDLEDARLSVRQIEEQIKGLSLPADESELKNAQASITQYESRTEEINYSLTIDRTNIEKAQSDLERAQEDYDKNNQLFAAGVIARSELNTYADRLTEAKTQLENYQTQLENDTLAYTTNEANLEAAKAAYEDLLNRQNSESVQNQISQAQVQLEQARLRVSQLEDELAKYKDNEVAPFDGRISTVNQNDGATVLEDTSVLEMVDENDTTVYVDIPESDMPGITEGLDVILTGDGFDGEINATIESIKFEAEEKQIDNTNKNVVEAELSVDDKSLLRPGYTLDARIIKSVDENAATIPVMSYLTDDEGNDYVYIVNDDNRLEKRIVTLKTYSDMYISAEGVEVGERVVDSPDDTLLSEGMLVSDANAVEQTTAAQTTEKAVS